MSYSACLTVLSIADASTTEATVVIETGTYSPGSDWSTYLGGTGFTLVAPSAGRVLLETSFNASATLEGRFKIDGVAITEPNYADMGLQSDQLWQGPHFIYARDVTAGSHYFELQLKGYSAGGGANFKLGTRSFVVTFIGS